MADWYDEHEDDLRASMSKQSRMRVYIVAALIGLISFCIIGGVLHFFPI